MNEEVKEKTKEEVQKEEVRQESSPKTEPEELSKVKKEKKENKYKEQVAKLESELANLKNEYLKVFAEMENTKKRLKEETIKDRKYASQKIAGELIQPIDMLSKIVSSKAPSKEIENYLVGFQMICSQLMEALKKEGVSEIEALGKPFDPVLMQAMSVETKEDTDDNIVVQVLQTGYMFKDRVLRPAMVIVNKKNKEEKKEEE